MLTSCSIILAALGSLVIAYPAERSLGLLPRDCSAEVTAFNLARRGNHDHLKRTFYPNPLNLTCVLSPETPLTNYVANPLVRQDVTEGQSGVAFTLDVGIIDVTTCKPLPNVMVEIWSANAQGDYGNTFLRGASAASSSGIAEFRTIFPGYTSSGANHFNLMVFFTDKWTTIVGMSSPYNTNTHTRITNLDDPVYMSANRAGFYPVVGVLSIQDDWPEGVIGYITVGVNPSKAA